MKLVDFDFRIWDTTRNAYLYNPSLTKIHFKSAFCENAYNIEVGEVIDENNKNEGEISIGCLAYNRYKSVEIELWSGICDKNGERIFEGDIVKNRNLDTLLCLYDSHNLRFVFKYINRKEYDICYTDMDILEVIGNIHENADLLKESQ